MDRPTYLIMTGRKPVGQQRIFWWDMKFVTVNDLPVPFTSREDAQSYIDNWGLSHCTIWKLELCPG